VGFAPFGADPIGAGFRFTFEIIIAGSTGGLRYFEAPVVVAIKALWAMLDRVAFAGAITVHTTPVATFAILVAAIVDTRIIGRVGGPTIGP
jgi:hypothetical protein